MKKLLSVILIVSMLLSCMALLFSCNKEEDNSEEKTPTNSTKYDEGTIFYERAQVDDGLETVDYGGRKFRIATNHAAEFFVPEDKRNQGNLIKDATYERTKKVEDRFNVEIEIVYEGLYQDVNDYISKTILSAADEFDLATNLSVALGGIVNKNLFLNWYDIENVDFTKPWWANMEPITVNDVALLAVSDINIGAITNAHCIVFNKNLASAYDLGNLYELVLDGDWTYDTFYEIIKDVYHDSNGNDAKDSSDFYGFAQSPATAVNSYLQAFNNPICAKDEEGVPQVSIMTSKIDSIVTTLYDLFYNTDGVYYDTSEEAVKPADMFLAKKAVFATGSLASPLTEGFRNFEDDYGILPYPKWDENQTEYLGGLDGSFNLMGVPKTCRDTEFVGTIVEALSAESWKIITPTIYETALKTRYLRDNESKEVLDIIINGRYFDFGYVFDNWKGFGFVLETMMKNGNNSFQSTYAARKINAQAQIKKTVKAFQKLG